MKHLKLFESFIGNIHSICEIYGIKNYTINEDRSIDANGTVYLDSRNFKELPLKFRNVSGNFNCSHNQLTSLEGCPKSVGGGFYCYNNQLTSLEGCPKSVDGDFDCDNNKIVTFEHLPFSIGGDFYCLNNPIFEIWGLFRDYSKIEFLNDCDAIREPDDDSEYPIIILDRLNYFLEEIGKKLVKVRGYKCI
jgi:hypothetical protein